MGRSEGVADKTDERKRPIEEEGASGVEGAGSVNEKVCTVDAGWSVEAIISTSRVKDNWGGNREKKFPRRVTNEPFSP